MITSVLLAISMTALSGCAKIQVNSGTNIPEKEPVNESHIYQIEEKTMPMYLTSDDEKIDVDLVFLDGVTEEEVK